MRVYIDFLLIFFIPLGVFLSEAKRYMVISVIILSSITIPLNIIQTYQYKEYILHWDYMTKKKYWKVFLKTDPIYKGLLWRESTSLSNYSVLKTIKTDSFEMKPNEQVTLYNKSEELSVDAIAFEMSSQFNEQNHTRLSFYIHKDDSLVHYLHTYLIHLEKDGFNNYHKGRYINKTPQISNPALYSVNIFLVNDEHLRTLEPIKITYLKKNN
jgi:hypothetical protein